MLDLWRAIAVMTLGVAVIGVAASLLVGNHRQRQMLLVALSSFGMFAFLFYAAGRLYWAIAITDSAVIIWSNLTPLLAAVAAGVCVRLAETPLWRRIVMGLALTATAVASVLWPFLNIWLRPPPPGGNVWNGPVAMQTAWATCSPAAAATFLNAGGIDVTEAEMVPRCLTDASGTPTLGLYRGLKVTARSYSRDVEARLMSLEELTSSRRFPLLIMVRLPESGVDDPRYERDWGWVPGVGHSVVILDRDGDDRFLIGDPAAGTEFWSRADLQVLWHGDVIRFKAIPRPSDRNSVLSRAAELEPGR